MFAYIDIVTWFSNEVNFSDRENNGNLSHKYGKLKKRRKLVSGKTWTQWNFKLLYYCRKQLFCLWLYNIMQNRHIIVHLTEVLVSYTWKYNVLHMAPVHRWNFSSGNFNAHSLPSLVGERDLNMSLKSGANVFIASDWLIWKDTLINYMLSYMSFRKWGRPRETTHLP